MLLRVVRDEANSTSGPRIITPSSFNDDRKVPAALVLPPGKFFFGYKYVPFDPTKAPKPTLTDTHPKGPVAFSGLGSTVNNRQTALGTSNPVDILKKRESDAKEQEEEQDKPDLWDKLGGGNSLRPDPGSKTNGHRPPSRQEVIDATMLDEEDFTYEMDDDDGFIEIDSD